MLADSTLDPVRGTMFNAGPAVSVLTQSPGHGQRDLFGVPRVGEGVGRGPLRHRDQQAIEHRAAVVIAAARQERPVRAERARPRPDRDVLRAAYDAGRQTQDLLVSSRCGKRGDDLPLHDGLPLRCLDVDNRTLAGDDNRLLDGAELHLGVDPEGESNP